MVGGGRADRVLDDVCRSMARSPEQLFANPWAFGATLLRLPVVNGMLGEMKKRLRIIQVVNVRWFNATAWYGLSLSRLLKEAGHDVLVLAPPDTEASAKARTMGFEPVSLGFASASPFALAGELRRLRALLREFRPHIVNCHRGEGMLFWGMFKALGHDFALVRTRGDQRPPKANLPNRWLHARLADALIVTNSRTARQCRTLLGVPEDRLHIILGGVDTGRFAPDEKERALVRANLGFGPDDLVVGLLGRFDAVKGQRELMEALSRVRSGVDERLFGRGGRLRLMLMGFPTSLSEEKVREWIRDYGLEERTEITGRVERPSAYINAMDLGVVASQGSEAIARAALEIMACDVPLVSTDVGVMPDLLPEWALVPPGDSSALAGLLERALNDDFFRRALQEAARERMQELSERSFLERTIRVYDEVLGRRDGSTTRLESA